MKRIGLRAGAPGLALALAVVLISLLVDIVNALVDPRVRY